MAGNPRQDLYLEISRNLLDEELTDLQNYVSGAKYLPAGFVQKANAHRIFNQLETKGKLKSGDLSLLAKLLRIIGRNDYAEEAEKIAENERNSQEELPPRYEPPWRLVRSEGSWQRKRRSENYEQGNTPATSSGRQRASLEEIAYNRQNVKTEDDYEPVRKRPRQDPKKPRQDPFVLQIKRERVMKCQGCKQEFGNPIPPANLVIEHFDNYPYNRKGAVINSWRPGYFHTNFGCIKPRYSDFDPHEVVVPPSTVENLTKPHMKYCRTYGILLSVDDKVPVTNKRPQNSKKPRQYPFMLQMKTEMVQKCQGCKQQFGNPIPPTNLVIRHYDNYQYFDKREGSNVDSWRNGYFHANSGCIKPRYPDFDPHEVVVPPSTVENLTKPHMKYCRKHGILLSVDDKVPVTNKRPQNPKKSRQYPFMLQMKTKMVQKCQGCKQQFGDPIPPTNIIIRHFDNYPYNKKGSVVDSWRNGYFHANFGCIKPRYRDFDPHEVVVPPSTRKYLTPAHVNYCEEHDILLPVGVLRR